MSSVDTLQGITSNLFSSTNQSNGVEQSISSLSSIGESFSELFAQSQAASNAQETVLALTTSNVTENLNTMQEELLANLLGYNSGVNALASATGKMTDVTTEFSLDTLKESFQSNLLSALQANTLVSSSVEAVTVVSENTLLEKLSSLAFNDDGFGLEDVFDTVNIAQHIPIVASIYEATTDQESISNVAQLAGDFLYGGPIGLAYSVADMAIESYTGTSIGDAITQFDYSGFLFGGVATSLASSSELEADTSANTTDKTLFFDKYNNVLFGRE